MEDIINQWNKAALRYTEDQENSEFSESNKRVVKSRFEHFNGEKILDIGCGYGLYTDYFRSIGANAIGFPSSVILLPKSCFKEWIFLKTIL